MVNRLLTTEQVAEAFGVTPEQIDQWRRRLGWPHVKIGRTTIRFTEEQVATIVAAHSVTPAARPVDPLERAGLTARSAAHHQRAHQ